MVMAVDREELEGGAGALLDMRATWMRAVSKRSGATFYIVPSLTDPEAVSYYTTEYGCTCPAARKSRTGDCKHQRLVREYNALQGKRWASKGHRRP